jgi:dienelactone hydrolase
MRTSNVQLPTSNIERESVLRRWTLEVGRSTIAFLFLVFWPLVSTATYDPAANKVDSTSIDALFHDPARDRDVPVKVYYPTTATDTKSPVIIFSHGLGGSREGYGYLGSYWASHGYVAVHLTHIGTDTEAVMANGLADMKKTMLTITANPMNAVDRCKDVSFAIDQIIAANDDDKSPLKGRLDLKHIGMAGHSYGANTTMLISGEMTRSGHSFADNRITCAIAMSPPVATPKNMWDKVYAGVKIPLFVMTGTLDDSPIGESKAADRRVPYDHVGNIPAYLITFTDGDHMVFSGRRIAADRPKDDHFHELILQGSTAYWDAYLRSDESAKRWLKEDYAKAVAADGVFEQK